MFYHVILTSDCNLRCRYCSGKCEEDVFEDPDPDFDYSFPKKISYNIEHLKDFIAKDSDATVTFYGGEPLLEIETITKLIELLPAKRFMMQTNGLLLHKLPDRYLKKLHTILVSIDGDEKATDKNRGAGTFGKVMDNIKELNRRGFKGELIARMTITEGINISKEAWWLMFNDIFQFSSVHWQLDAGFWKKDYKKRNFEEWITKEYNPQIKELIEKWAGYMALYGKVLKFYPFIGIMKSIFTGEPSKLRCGAGWTNFCIMTDGNITPCPVTEGMKKYYQGDIFRDTPKSLKKIYVGKPCTSCDIFHLCGGRCLYSNILKPWGEKGLNEICLSIRFLISELQKTSQKIKSLIDKKVISLKDFDYIKYNGTEIIP